jgi:Rrf2 family protein
MRVTTRTHYAMRALYDLAFHRPGQAAQAKEIAERQNVPLRFLEQILQDLRRAGLVEARRGPRGGYALARPPGEVSMADVMRAVRGPLDELFGGKGAKGANGSRHGESEDVPSVVWADVSARLTDVLERTTLQDFVARAEAAGVRRAGLPATMYFI